MSTPIENASTNVHVARHAMGRKVIAEALVAHDGFSARYDLNRLTGVFSRPAHQLVGQSYIDRILVLDTAKGGVASAWMLYEMQSRRMAPLGIVFNTVNPILAQGAALGDITMLAGFDVDITAAVAHLAIVELDPDARTLRVLSAREAEQFARGGQGPDAAAVVRGPRLRTSEK